MKDIPRISIIIPTYNRAERLQACLEALGRQTLPPDNFEVIVVIDGSTDKTYQLVSNLDTPFPMQVITQENHGPSVARNRGIEQARGRFGLFIDDDIIAGPELVSSHLRVQEAHYPVVALGKIIMKLPDKVSPFTYYYGERWNKHYESLNRGECPPTWIDCFSGNLSLPIDAFLKIGGFNNNLEVSEDVELGFRLHQHGLTFSYIDEASGVQDERKEITQLLCEAEVYGRTWIELSQRHPDMIPAMLGMYFSVNYRETKAHQFLLRFPKPYWLLSILGRLIPKEQHRYKWYRFIHNHGYWRGMRHAVSDKTTWERLTYGTLILCYHALGEDDEPASTYVLPVRKFESQMSWLKRRGYRVITLEELITCIIGHNLPPARSVVITFDDGYMDNFSLAYPILHRYNFPATFFLVSHRPDNSNYWDQDEALANRPLLSLEEILEMSRHGMQFGAHGRTHKSLTSIGKEKLTAEVEGSKSDLEKELDLPIHLFAYPYGEYDEFTHLIAEKAGYWGSCTIDKGTNSISTPIHALRRFMIKGNESFIRFMLLFR